MERHTWHGVPAVQGGAGWTSGLRLTATDVEWTVGDGAEVRGPIQVLLLLLTGRTGAALPELIGPGVQRLAGERAQP